MANHPSGAGDADRAAAAAPGSVSKHSNSLSSIGDASGVAILLGNHARFGLAERCCYHFDLIETLTSVPIGRAQQAKARRRDRGLSVSSQEGGAATGHGSEVKSGPTAGENNDASKEKAPSGGGSGGSARSFCGVVSLLECVASSGAAQPERTLKRALRSKHREFNTRAQVAWGRTTLKRRDKLGGAGTGGAGGAPSAQQVVRRCHQPRHLPLPLSPNTRVTFAYELTSIAIVLDASPSLTSTFGVESMLVDDFGGFGEEKHCSQSSNDGCCVPLDRLGKLIKVYLEGLVQPIEVPPVAVSGLGVQFGRWKPNLAVTVVAAYPPTSQGGSASAGLLVRDFRVTDETSARELASHVERWALGEVEGRIAQRLCGDRRGGGIGTMSSLGEFPLPYAQQQVGSWTRVKSFMRDILAVGDAALTTLPSEGRPVMLVATDCRNVVCGGVFESLSETARADVPISVLDLSSPSPSPNGSGEHGAPSSQLFSSADFSPSSLSVSNDSQSLRDACHLSGGVFLHPSLLDPYISSTAGSFSQTPQLQLDGHFSSKKRTIKPNALQWYTLFSLSPFTPAGSSSSSRSLNAPSLPSGFYRASSVMSFSGSSVSSAKLGKAAVELPMPAGPFPPLDNKAKGDVAHSQERIVLARYNVQPVRIKSLLMTRVVEGFRAKRYGHNTIDKDKVSVHFVLRLADCNVTLHYEASFVSSPYHTATVGQAHIKLELSGDDPDFLATVKKMFVSSHSSDTMMLHGRRVPASLKAAADKICKLLRWTRKEDYLESYLCLPGWGDANHFAAGSSFLSRLESLSQLQRFRHFRSETLTIVTIGPSYYENSASIFSDVMEQNEGEAEMYSILSSWSTGSIVDGKMWFKLITPPQDDDLAYYCTIRVAQSTAVSRLFTITLDFHADPTAEERISVLDSLRDELRTHSDHIAVLGKNISGYVTRRPATPSHPSNWNEYFLHHKSWELLQDSELLPLLTKRRSEIGKFFILDSSERKGVFAKFVSEKESDRDEQGSDFVIYQVIWRSDGIIVVDILMEASRSTFFPFHPRHSHTEFSRIFQNVKQRDTDCAQNLRSRSRLLSVLDNAKAGIADSDPNEAKQADDVSRLCKLSFLNTKKLRFFSSEESGSANEVLRQLTTQHIASEVAARLSIDQSTPILGRSGTWFIRRMDWYVVSLVCLEHRDQVEEQDGTLLSFRGLSFFTAGIIDLYQSETEQKLRDGKNSDGDDDNEDYFGVSDIAEAVQSAHAKNFSRACYQGLRDTSDPITSLQHGEIAYALSSLVFVESLHTFVSVDDLSDHLSSDAQTMTGTKLVAVILTLLKVVPGSNGRLLFYYGHGDFEPALNDVLSDAHDNFGGEDMAELSSERGASERAQSFHDETDESGQTPMFFRFTLDDEQISLDEILTLKKSAALAAEVSVYQVPQSNLTSAPRPLPPSHKYVNQKLQNALESFASEQSLEKYRFAGRSLTLDVLEEVQMKLTKTKHKSSCVPIEFFISKSKSLVAADNPTGSNESDLNAGFRVLMEELERADAFTRAGEDSFLVLDDSASRDVLPYWCFIKIIKSRGCVLQVYHPLGDEAAKQQVEVAKKLVKTICDQTNRLLLLGSLYSTRNACNLLIAEEDGESTQEGGLEPAPTYACPVQHRATIPLHRRCVPQQVIMALETSILANFLVSNRRHYFVYKDEAENVFYLQLSWHKVQDADETEQNPHLIELVVYGCDEPGPSITDHLVCLLKRKLLTLTLDALSNLLKKNPFFNVTAPDLGFIQGFSSALRELEHESIRPSSDYFRIYTLPEHIQDPLLLMLMFRQNICGSTFIHPLFHEESLSDAESEVFQLNESELKISFASSKQGHLPDFQFYFNSFPVSPSQLNPHYHKVTTLTEKGRQYSRQAGSGLAIIEVNLKRDDNEECEILVGKRGHGLSKTFSKSEISLSPNDSTGHNGRFRVIVNIVNTTVDAEVIHKWVELSLSQVLAAHTIELHLESCRLGLVQSDVMEESQTSSEKKLDCLNRTLGGYPVLEKMISIAADLPHPAIAKVNNTGNLRATVLANLTFELLEGMLASIANKKRIADGVDIMRYTPGEGKASLVKITRDYAHPKCCRVEQSGKEVALVRDKPTDSPEYIAVYGFNNESQKSSNEAAQPLFFKQVEISSSTQQDASAFSHALSVIKKAKPSLFRRHLVIILKVSRTERVLMTYNVDPESRAKLEGRFKEIEQAVVKAEEQSRTVLQGRCLQHVSFLPNEPSKRQKQKQQPKETPPESASTNKPAEKKSEVTEVAARPARRIPRPTSMLRPKLIGKSVEGAAMQAVQASRLRASTRPSIPPKTNKPMKKAAPTPPQGDRPKDKGQKKKRESKDAASLVRASAPRASLLKSYRLFLALFKDGPEVFSAQHRLNQFALQHLAHMFFVSSKEKAASLLSTRLMCTCYSYYFGAGCIEQLECDREISSARAFVDHLASRCGMRRIVPTGNIPYSSYWPQLIYLQKDLLTSPFRRAIVLIEVSILWDNARGSFILSYNAWLINSIDKAKSNTRRRRPYAFGRIEREAAAIEAIALDFTGRLNLRVEQFNYACFRVLSPGVGPPTLAVLKSVIGRYSAESQAQLTSPGYRLQRRFLAPSSFLEGPLLDSCKKAHLSEHLLAHCQEYDLSACDGSGNNTCFSGKMNVAGFVVYYLIAWHESVESALDVFVLCVTKGNRVDGYITKEGTPFAEKTLDVILYTAMSTVQDMVESAAKAIRKLHLWQMFGVGYSPSLLLGDNVMATIAELRKCSFSSNLLSIDPCLETLLYDEQEELQLSWQGVFSAIARSPPFSHCAAFNAAEASTYLVYMKEEDVFLDFVVHRQDGMQEARILTREPLEIRSKGEDAITARCAVRKFTLFLLQWLWVDCENTA